MHLKKEMESTERHPMLVPHYLRFTLWVVSSHILRDIYLREHPLKNANSAENQRNPGRAKVALEGLVLSSTLDERLRPLRMKLFVVITT